TKRKISIGVVGNINHAVLKSPSLFNFGVTTSRSKNTEGSSQSKISIGVVGNINHAVLKSPSLLSNNLEILSTPSLNFGVTTSWSKNTEGSSRSK
ncbi:hypothetical protein ACJX0J_014868, partial [Zea mays]